MKMMNELKINEKAIIKNIPESNPLRHRFFDLGLIKNTLVKCVAISPFGDPKAYKIRDTVIAIREDDCYDISVEEQIK